MLTEQAFLAAQAKGVRLTPGGAKALSDHAELELRKIIEDAARFMRISKRTVLKPSDINFALQSRGEQPVFGYELSTPHALQRVPGVPGIYKEDDEEIDLSTLINEPFPPIPHPPSFTAHWLAIDGVQPLILQNPIPSKLLDAIQRDPSSILSDPSLAHELGIDTAQVGQGQSYVYGNGIEIKPPIKHDLSQELQLFYEKATQFILDVKDSLFENRIEGEPQQQQNFTSSQAVSNITDAQHRLESVYQSISGDPGLQQLMPYFSQFVATETIRNLHNCAVLYSIMRFVSAIFSSPYLNVDPYCHILIPAVLTCTLSNELGTLEDREYAKGGVLAQNDLGSIIVSTSGKVESSSSKRITQSSSGISSQTSTSNASYPQQPKQRQVAPQPQITNSTPERAFRVTHFDVRRFSALLLSKICRRLAISFSTFEMRLANTLVLSLLDPTRTLASHYGATVSLVALGPHVFYHALLSTNETTKKSKDKLNKDNKHKDIEQKIKQSFQTESDEQRLAVYIRWLQPSLCSDDANQRSEAEMIMSELCEALKRISVHPTFEAIMESDIKQENDEIEQLKDNEDIQIKQKNTLDNKKEMIIDIDGNDNEENNNNDLIDKQKPQQLPKKEILSSNSQNGHLRFYFPINELRDALGERFESVFGIDEDDEQGQDETIADDEQIH